MTATGTLVRRDAENVNPNLPTGEVELLVDELTVHAAAETPPFPIDEDGYVDETLRLRHRALDLRRTPMQEALKLRHVVTRDDARRARTSATSSRSRRRCLTRSTPEGARDYLVPARIDPGSFYALPQSPQLFKQLLMVGGFERYYQIARCFRDEDTRADRQPEFTQLDLEMSFVDEDDVIETMEAVMGAIFAAADFPVAARAVAADVVRGGDAALRLRPARHPLRPGDQRAGRRSSRGPSSRSSPARSPAAA